MTIYYTTIVFSVFKITTWSQQRYSVTYTLLCWQTTKSNIRPKVKLVVSLVIADDHLYLPPRSVSACME